MTIAQRIQGGCCSLIVAVANFGTVGIVLAEDYKTTTQISTLRRLDSDRNTLVQQFPKGVKMHKKRIKAKSDCSGNYGFSHNSSRLFLQDKWNREGDSLSERERPVAFVDAISRTKKRSLSSRSNNQFYPQDEGKPSITEALDKTREGLKALKILFYLPAIDSHSNRQ